LRHGVLRQRRELAKTIDLGELATLSFHHGDHIAVEVAVDIDLDM